MVVSTRSFSEARDKLRTVMEEYRKKNYGQELPSRFAKEVTQAADLDKDGFLCVSEISQLLENIGAKDSLTPEEISTALEEMGDGSCEKGVPIENVVEYVKHNSKPGVA